MKPKMISARMCIGLMMVLTVAIVAQSPTQETALDRYIAKPDPVYGWKLIGTIPGPGYRGYVLELTSQSWRTEAEVDRPVWKHWLTVVKPDRVTTNKALLFIGGGSNRDPAPKAVSERTAAIAVETNSVVAELGMVPNQPLFFSDSKDQARSEDDLIAYTRVKHFTTKDDFWLVRLAMVKSGVRAMDAIQAFLASDAGGKIKVDQFVVSGSSKRGWTTWLVGAVDKRVIAIAPMVIDALNSELITRHHFEAYGFFSTALNDYVNHGLFPHKIGTPEYQAVLKIEDPYQYRNRERLKIPKFLINASGDQFFLPDNSRFYFDALQDEKYLRYVPNAKHNLAGSDARESLTAFYQAVLAGRARPRFSWKQEKDGSFVVSVKDPPKEVNLWQASNPNARDFRVDTIGNAYTKTTLAEQKRGVYVGRVEKPAQGFTAYFVELVYDSGGKYPFKFTTNVGIAPDVLPFDFKDAAKKYPGSAREPRAVDASAVRAPSQEYEISERARKLHFSSLVLDTHIDVTPKLQTDWKFAEEHPTGHIDLPRMKKGGLNGLFFSIYMSGRVTGPKAVNDSLERIAAVHKLAREMPDQVMLCTTAAEVRQAHRQGRVAALMGMEGGHMINNSLPILRMYAGLGVRYLTLTHSVNTDWADSSGDQPKHNGLTEFGKEVVRELNRLGVMVDISHVADKTFYDALEVSTAPMIASHSSCRALSNHPRNMTDDMIKALAAKGGVIQINYLDSFIDPALAEYSRKAQPLMREYMEKNPGETSFAKAREEVAKVLGPGPKASWEKIVEHIDHAVKLVGADHVGLGSDFDGGSMPVGMEDCSKLPKITEALLRKGYRDADIRKILGGNTVRLLAEVERAAARMRNRK